MVGQVTERLGEPVLGERPGVHPLREAGQVLACGIELVDELEEGDGRRAVAVPASAASSADTSAEHLLGSATQLLAEPATLLVTCLDEPAA